MASARPTKRARGIQVRYTMEEYQKRFLAFLEDRTNWDAETSEDGTLLVASLNPIELFINLTHELVHGDETYGTEEQLKWALRTLLSNKWVDNLKDVDTFLACDWLCLTSNLDPKARKVTFTL